MAGVLGLVLGGGGPAVAADPGMPQPDPTSALTPVGVPQSPVSAKQVAKALSGSLSDPVLAGPVGVAVLDGASGRTRYAAKVNTPLVPASTLKLLTAVAALDALGSTQRIATRVVLTSSGQLVLVGGGDATLTDDRQTSGPASLRPASLAALAAQTARYAKRHHLGSVRLGYDDALFSGPAVNPKWEPDYVPSGVIAPVTALMVDEGRVDPYSAQRVPDPAASAAQQFAAQLRAQGVTVARTVSAEPGAGGTATTTVATVESAPMSVVVEQMLRDSDNQVAEALGRLAAIADGQPGSFQGASTALLATAQERQLPVSGWRVYDASGLSRADRATASGLAATLELAIHDPTLAPIVVGLPVAGFSGTLDDRYLVGPARLAAGIVRAKTGTLSGANAEVGLVVTRGGQLLVFAFVANGVVDTDAARDALDRAATALYALR
jgi:serine-type D-Ala-D-Ala carboxypeptidase/endopeptidase (penicillin-binding protein 4)